MLLHQTMKELLSLNRLWFFLTLCLGTFLLLYAKKTFIENETAAFVVLEQRGEMGVIHMINGLQYLSIPLFYLYKFTITALVLWIGSFMFGYRVNYNTAWAIAMVAEVLFLLPEILKLCWFIFAEKDPNIFDIRAFYPFSLMQLWDHETLAPKWHYPLKALNVFEVLYWFLLMSGIHVTARKKYPTAQAIVLSSYVLFFLLWLVFYVLIYK